MICTDCDSTKIDVWVKETLVSKSYDSVGQTGKDLIRYFNPVGLGASTKITCSGCGETLKEVFHITYLQRTRRKA